MASAARPAALDLFRHRHLESSGASPGYTLLLLHGTGGDENDLIPLGHALAPGAAVLSPRGSVLENGMPRFFRRIAEGVFDIEDLHRRTRELAEFLDAARDYYKLTGGIVAVGFSNGANIGGSLLLTKPDALAGAVLIRPMVPFEPETPPKLTGIPVWLGAGRTDTLVPRESTERLAAILKGGGAEVTTHWSPGGHGLTAEEVEVARRWLAARFQD